MVSQTLNDTEKRRLFLEKQGRYLALLLVLLGLVLAAGYAGGWLTGRCDCRACIRRHPGEL